MAGWEHTHHLSGAPMRLFARRGTSPLAFARSLTPDEAWRLRETVRWVFVESGRDVALHDSYAEDDTGQRFEFAPLATICADAPVSEWGSLARAHVRSLWGTDVAVVEPAKEEPTQSVRLRLAAWGPELAARQPSAARPVPELAEVLVMDRPSGTDLADECELEDLPGGLTHWRQVARQGLVERLSELRLEHELSGWTPEDAFHAVAADSPDAASGALVPDALLARLGLVPGDAGVLLAVPAPHQIGLRVVDGPDAAMSLHHLFRFAQTAYRESPDGISPHVFWVDGERWTQVTRIEDGHASVSVDEELGVALGLGREVE